MYRCFGLSGVPDWGCDSFAVQTVNALVKAYNNNNINMINKAIASFASAWGSREQNLDFLIGGAKSTETFEYGELASDNHKHTEVRDAKKATEQEKGYTGDTWCLDCNKKIAEGKDIEKLEHKPVLVKAEEATAAKEGNIEYYYCENCGKYYSDKAGTKEIAEKDTVVSKLAPKIIDGNNAKFDKSSKEPLSFRSDAAVYLINKTTR